MENEDANEFRKFEVPEAKFYHDMPRSSFRGKMGLKFFSCCYLDCTYQHDSSIKKKGEKLRYLFLTSGKMDVCFGFFKRRLWYLQSTRVTRLKHSRVEMSLLNLAFTKRMKKYAILAKNQKAGIVSTLPIACNLQSPLKMEWNGLLYHVWFDTFFKPSN